MKALSWSRLAIMGVVGLGVGAVLSFVLLRIAANPLIITPWLGLLFLVVAIALWVSGRSVNRLKQHKSTKITPIQASRVALFARSGALNGVLFAGFLFGVAGVGLFRLWAPATAASAIGAGIAGVGALVLCLVSMLVERWCIDDSDNDREDSGKGTGRNPRHERPGQGAHGAAMKDWSATDRIQVGKQGK